MNKLLSCVVLVSILLTATFTTTVLAVESEQILQINNCLDQLRQVEFPVKFFDRDISCRVDEARTNSLNALRKVKEIRRMLKRNQIPPEKVPMTTRMLELATFEYNAFDEAIDICDTTIAFLEIRNLQPHQINIMNLKELGAWKKAELIYSITKMVREISDDDWVIVRQICLQHSTDMFPMGDDMQEWSDGGNGDIFPDDK